MAPKRAQKRPAANPVPTQEDLKPKGSIAAPNDPWKKVWKEVFRKLGDVKIQKLKDIVTEIGGIPLSGSCSGSNVFIVQVILFLEELGCGKILRLFECENAKLKQKFLRVLERALAELGAIGADTDGCILKGIEHLHRDTAPCFTHSSADSKTEKTCPVHSSLNVCLANNTGS